MKILSSIFSFIISIFPFNKAGTAKEPVPVPVDPGASIVPATVVEQPQQENVDIKVAPPMSEADLIAKSVESMMLEKGYKVSVFPEEGNIVFLKGRNTDMSVNDNRIGVFNDSLVVFRYDEFGVPRAEVILAATTSPGRISTPLSEQRGGMAQVVEGQYKAWRMGYHKQREYGRRHPALVQCAAIEITRGFNKDGLPKNKKQRGMFGINIHSTSESFHGESVGGFSEGCLVVKDFYRFKNVFLKAISQWPCMSDNNHIFTVSIL